MKADNAHHGGICEYCYQTTPFVPLDQPRQPIKHLEDCQRDNPEAQARLKTIKARQPRLPEHLVDAPFDLSRQPEVSAWVHSLPIDLKYDLHVAKMRAAAKSMVKSRKPQGEPKPVEGE